MNTPYFVGSNDENAMETSPLAPPNTIRATPNRRPLGEVSTNPRVYGSSPATGGLFGGQKRALMGSPLKRSFTAAVEEGYGLKYLKRRRGEGDVLGFKGMENRMGRTGGRIEEGVAHAGAGPGPVDPAIGGVRAQSVPEGVVTHHAPLEHTAGFPPSPTEPNTPSDSGGETQGSFSSLIDYDPSSQHATTTARPRSRQKKKKQKQRNQQQQQWNSGEEQQYQQQSIPQPLAPPNSPPKTISHAETLRLRLHLAMYKIQTNQIHLPFSKLQLPNPQTSSSSNRQHIHDAVEEAVASLRREAMERMPKQGQTPTTLIPGPLLHPTAHSSRLVPHPERQKAASRLPPVGVFGRHGSAPLPSGMRGEIEGWER